MLEKGDYRDREGLVPLEGATDMPCAYLLPQGCAPALIDVLVLDAMSVITPRPTTHDSRRFAWEGATRRSPAELEAMFADHGVIDARVAAPGRPLT